MKEIGIYLHIPFCLRKCFYCAFNSYPWQEGLADSLVEGLKKEIKLWGKDLAPFPFQVPTLFLGGGTPTCLKSKQLAEILDCCYQHFPLSSQAEISVEANPGTVDREKLETLLGAGVNRLSFGVQSLDNRFLQILGRIHSREEFLQNFHLAREVGFNNINLDLIFALPGQNLADWQKTLQEAVELKPEHLSTYNLVIEEGTVLEKKLEQGQIAPVDEEIDLAMYQETIDFLAGEGYVHYEISNFAKPGKECRHNLIYWQNKEYLGLGPGAHSYWQKQRFFNLLSPEDYWQKLAVGVSPILEREAICPELEMGETMMQGLRLREGISFAEFRQRFGHSLEEVYPKQLRKLRELGLVEEQKKSLRLTRRGLYLANQVFQEFLP